MNIRNVLEACRDWDFHLVGSQALGTAGPDSDWDYVVTAKEGVWAFLRKLGFTSVNGIEVDSDRLYGDNQLYVKAIVQKICPATGVNVQVAIVADASLKLRIMNVLKKNKTLRDFDLSLHGTKRRNWLWDAMYMLAGWEGHAGDESYGREKEKFAVIVNTVDADPGF